MESNGRNLMVQGRIVWISGDLFAGKLQTQFGTQVPKLNKQGEQTKQYGFGLAVDRNTLFPNGQLAPNTIWTAIHEEAFALYPSRQTPPGFAFKFKDGDRDVDQNGELLSKKDGYPGHMVFACTTNLPIKFFRWDDASKQNVMINEGIHCGDYVQVQLTIKAHGPIEQGKPGIYLNPVAVLFLGHGPRIINTPSGDDIFGKQAPALPAGASATPLAPQPGQMLVAPPPAAYPGQAPYMPPPAAQPAPAPHYNVIPQHLQPAPAAAPQMYVPPSNGSSMPLPNSATPAQGAYPPPGFPMPR